MGNGITNIVQANIWFGLLPTHQTRWVARAISVQLRLSLSMSGLLISHDDYEVLKPSVSGIWTGNFNWISLSYYNSEAGWEVFSLYRLRNP